MPLVYHMIQWFCLQMRSLCLVDTKVPSDKIYHAYLTQCMNLSTNEINVFVLIGIWYKFSIRQYIPYKHDTRNNVWFCQQMNSLCLSWYRCLGTEVPSDWPHTRLMPGTSCSRFLPDPCTIPPRSEKSLYADSLTSR